MSFEIHFLDSTEVFKIFECFFLGWAESTVVKFVTKEKILYKVIWLRNFQFHIAVVKTYYEAQAKSDCKSDSQNLLEV